MKGNYRKNVSVVAVLLLILSQTAYAQEISKETKDQDADTGDEPKTTDKVEEKTQRPGLFDVDEEAATRALERSLILIDALLLAPGKAVLGLDLGYSYDALSSPVLIEFVETDGGGVATAVATATKMSRDYSLSVDFQFGLPSDTQLDFRIPLEVSTVSDNTSFVGGLLGRASATESGVGDISVSLLKTVLHEKGRRPDIIARVTYDSDSLSDAKAAAIGSGAQEISFGLNATKRQDPLVFTYGLSHTVAFKKDGFRAGPATQVSIGTVLAASPNTSLRFAFDQIIASDAEFDDESIEGSGANISAMSFGVSSVVSQWTSLAAGIRFSLTDAGTDYSITLGLSRRFDLAR